MNGEDDDDRRGTTAEEIAYWMDQVIDSLDAMERIIDRRPDGLVMDDANRRRMQSLLLQMLRDTEELFTLAKAAADQQNAVSPTTN